MSSSQLSTGAPIADLFDLFSQPARVQIMMVISEHPACVCHLVAALGLRQASISQHLIMLRKAGWVTTRREGRNIYYTPTKPELITLIQQAAQISNIPWSAFETLSRRPLAECPCPKCHPELPPEYSCKSLPRKF